VFIVASARNDINPAAILFEFEGVRRDIAPSREARQSVAPTVTAGPPFSRTGNDRVETEAIITMGPTVMVPIAWDEELNASIDQAGTLLRGGDGGRHDGVMAFQVGPQSGEFTDIGPIRYGDHQQDTLHHESGIMSTLPAGSKDNMGHYTNTVHGMAVRRLTPVECERLQGFPDNYTNIKDKCPDGPRYKALGNSWAVPVVRWIGERIARSLG
jgi:DNA (cytosine-5)-methyltransferase 1